MSVKGSWTRPTQISKQEKDLRYELAFECEGKPERKKEILKLINNLKDGKSNG